MSTINTRAFMYKSFFIFLLTTLCCYSQEVIQAQLKDATHLKVDRLFGIDSFGTLFYTNDNISFYKKDRDTTISYANFQLGKITSANTFNPLKINLFYKDFNTVVILDNRLAEIYKVNFNQVQPYKNITFVSTGFSNTLWLFNQDEQHLELYDYKINKTRFKTIPIQAQVLDLKTDYNYCFMLTKSHLYIYNYFGSLVHKIKNPGCTELAFSKANLILKKDNQLYILPKNKSQIQTLQHPKMLINQFLVVNETMYIYANGILKHYQLKK